MSAQDQQQVRDAIAQALLSAEYDPSAQPFFARVHQEFRRAWSGYEPRSTFLDMYVDRFAHGEDLAPDEAEHMCQEIVTGDLAEDQIGALLMLLRPEVMSASTIAAFANVMRRAATSVQPDLAPGEVLGDTCGTGSDTLGTFNVSTTIMFVLAAAGIKIAKHGNYAITSRCGSADVLQELGVRIDLDAEPVEECIAHVGIGFMLAPIYHRAFKNLQKIRRILAEEMPTNIQARTVFNVLGPLSNPAHANTQLIGVYEPGLVRKFAEVLREIGITRALVAFGRCDGHAIGLDEVSTAGPTLLAELDNGVITESEITPEDVGLSRIRDPQVYRGGEKRTNAEILRRILAGAEDGPRLDLALINAGAGLYLGGKTASIKEGVHLAREIILSGASLRKLEEFREFTKRFA